MRTTLERDTAMFAGIRELARGDERGALQAFERALQGTDGAATGQMCTARLLVLQRRFDEARTLLKRITSAEPGVAEAWYLLGRVQREQYDIVAAARSFRAALAIDPRDTGASAGLAEIMDAQEP